MVLAAQRLCHALLPALWGFPAVASNERSPTNKGFLILKSRYLNKIQNNIFGSFCVKSPNELNPTVSDFN